MHVAKIFIRDIPQIKLTFDLFNNPSLTGLKTVYSSGAGYKALNVSLAADLFFC